MEDQREKCSGKPERKGRRFPYRPKDAPRPEPLANVPGPNHPRFVDIRPFFRQRKDDAECKRLEHLEQHRRLVEAIADKRIRRALEREEAERQRGIDEFWHEMNRKVKIGRETTRARGGPDGGDVRRATPGIGRGPKPPFALAAYPNPIIDRRGRVGVFMSSTYLSAKTTECGCMKRLTYYVTKPDHLENEDSFFSSMGEKRHEIACGMALVEDANRAARANAKVAVTFIVQLPHDVTPEERMTILRAWCEEKLGIHDLPFVAAVHKPNPDGDQRNYHGHVVTCFRPAYRTGPYEWRIARGLRTDLDNPAMFEEFRRDFATIMTAVVQIAGKDRIYTHLSHAARGLKHKPTEKLGPHKTRLVRAGKDVPADARNANIIATNEALAEVERIDERTARNRGRIDRLKRLKAAPARTLSPPLDRPARKVERSRPLSMPRRHAPPAMSGALLAAAARVEAKTSSPASHASQRYTETMLADVPLLQDAGLLDRSSSLSAPIAMPERVRPVPHHVSGRIMLPERDVTAGRRLGAIAEVARRGAKARLLSDKPLPVERPNARLRRLADVIPVTNARDTGRRTSHVAAPPADHTSARPLRPVPDVKQVRRQADLPSRPKPVEMGQSLTARQPNAVKPPPASVDPARLPAVPDPKRPSPASSVALSTVKSVEPPTTAPARRLSVVRSVDRNDVAARELIPVADGWPRLEARVRAVEADEATRANAAAKQADARRQQDYEQYLRFVALVALNPDWLEQGKSGLDVARHAPAKAAELYASWASDHERSKTIAEVRQAAFDGIHRLPPALAGEIARTIDALAPRLPAPSPPLDAQGRPSRALELAMALVAERPNCVLTNHPVRLSEGAVPALAQFVARHGSDPAIPRMLAAARRHGEGVAGALAPDLASRIDRRRADMALRRATGGLRVIAPDGKRLSPAMIDHLALAQTHPEWIRRHPRLGLGLSEHAPPIFRAQWTQWSEPVLARQLLLDIVAPTSTPRALTSAMRAQVIARVQALHGERAMAGRLPPASEEERNR